MDFKLNYGICDGVEKLEKEIERGCWNDCTNNTNWLSNFDYTVSLILFYNSTSLYITVSIINILSSVVVFDYLIFDHSHSCFFNSEFCKWNSCLVCRNRTSKKNLIYLLLRISRKLLLRFFNSFNLFFEFFNPVADAVV